MYDLNFSFIQTLDVDCVVVLGELPKNSQITKVSLIDWDRCERTQVCTTGLLEYTGKPALLYTKSGTLAISSFACAWSRCYQFVSLLHQIEIQYRLSNQKEENYFVKFFTDEIKPNLVFGSLDIMSVYVRVEFSVRHLDVDYSSVIEELKYLMNDVAQYKMWYMLNLAISNNGSDLYYAKGFEQTVLWSRTMSIYGSRYAWNRLPPAQLFHDCSYSVMDRLARRLYYGIVNIRAHSNLRSMALLALISSDQNTINILSGKNFKFNRSTISYIKDDIIILTKIKHVLNPYWLDQLSYFGLKDLVIQFGINGDRAERFCSWSYYKYETY